MTRRQRHWRLARRVLAVYGFEEERLIHHGLRFIRPNGARLDVPGSPGIEANADPQHRGDLHSRGRVTIP
jgi:hypothetical protein